MECAGAFCVKGRKTADTIFSFQFYVHIKVELFIHAFRFLCLVGEWFIYGGE